LEDISTKKTIDNIQEGSNTVNVSDQKRIQWHPAFVAAMALDVSEYRENMTFISEYELNRKPIILDLLIIKFEGKNIRNNSIASFFKGHNLLEYKGVGDELNINVFSKGLSYTYLYKSGETSSDKRPFEEITLSFIREAKPQKLFETLMNYKFSVDHVTDGVYHILNRELFDIQIVVLNEISFEEHPWLVSLTKKLSIEHAEKLLNMEYALKEKEDKDNAEALMSVVMEANKQTFYDVKGVEENMANKVMWEIMQPEIDEAIANAVEKKIEVIKIKDAEIADKDAKITELKNMLFQLGVQLT